MRDSNRTLQLKLRDIEVANDDFERQARNTTSSLEDMESKYNQAIERAVLMEEEIKIGEQEREQLRIESQRLKEEFSDLKIEAELLQDKIKKQGARHLSAISTDLSVLDSPIFDKNIDTSPNSTASSPLITTPPDNKSVASTADLSDLHDPPSPPMSDASAPLPKAAPSIGLRKSRKPPSDNSVTPKPRSKPLTAGNRATSSRVSAGGTNYRTPANRTTFPRNPSHKLPTSNSLTHIRSLTAQMQRLEARVQSARSKLPAPTHTPPRASPRSSLQGTTTNMPSTVTIRSRKRTIGSTTSSIAGDDTTPTNRPSTASKQGHVPRLSTSGVSRPSYGPLPNRGPESEISRPSSRASISSYARPASRNEMVPPQRPMSRASLSGVAARTPMGRPRSSLSGSVRGHNRTHSSTIHRIEFDEEDEDEYRTPSRRGTFSKYDTDGATSGIPVPGSSLPMPGSRRQSGSRRTSTSIGGRPSTSGGRRLADLGETY